MMNNKNNIATLWKEERYTIVPDALYQRCSKLNEASALFYCRLMDDYLNETLNYGKEYFPRHKELAIKFRIDEKTVKSRMKLLISLGLVIQTSNPGYANFLKVVDFRTLDILDNTDVAQEIAVHRNIRKLERAEQQTEWLVKTGKIDPLEECDIVESEVIVQIVEEKPVESDTEASSHIPNIDQEETTTMYKTECGLSDNQIKFYCDITNADFKHTKEMLKQEPTASRAILDVISDFSDKQSSDKFFSTVSIKADPYFTGSLPDNLNCPF
ncbi:hypothetical protein QUQ16_000172 [Escherichia coli]|nr:hypothetical protein [Escherichia coli]